MKYLALAVMVFLMGFATVVPAQARGYVGVGVYGGGYPPYYGPYYYGYPNYYYAPPPAVVYAAPPQPTVIYTQPQPQPQPTTTYVMPPPTVAIAPTAAPVPPPVAAPAPVPAATAGSTAPAPAAAPVADVNGAAPSQTYTDSQGRTCRKFQSTVDGTQISGSACLQQDGTWRTVEEQSQGSQ